jgi:ABC-2 type transport system permease protein
MDTQKINTSNTKWLQETIDRTLYLSQSDLQSILICTVPVLLAVLIFRYLQADKASVMMHSLPFKRSAHYASHCFSGLVLLLTPAVLTCLILILLKYFTVLGSYYTLPNIFMWLGLNVFFDVLFYSITVFIGMFTGSSIAQIVFTYIFHVLPVGIYTLITFSLGQLLYGFGNNPNSVVVENNYPIFLLMNGMPLGEVYTVGYFITYIIAAVILLGLGWLVYKYRKLEAAGDIIAFPALYPVFKYGVTFCLMLVGGTYLGGFSRQSFPMLIIGYILGSLIGYFVAEILLHKSFKVLHSYKGYLYYAAVILILFGGISLDVFGFVKRVPTPEEVNKVYLGYNLEEWVYFEKEKKPEYLEYRYGKNYLENNNPMLFESKESIAGITELHRHLIKERNKAEGQSRYIIYTLKNGGYIIRQYGIDETDQKDAALLKPIYESDEYKRLRFPATSLKQEDIKIIALDDHRSGKRPVILTSNSDLKDMTELLKNEISKMSYEEMTSRQERYISISVTDNKDKTTNMQLQSSFTSLIKWLEEKGYYEKFALLPDDIVSVELEKYEERIMANRAGNSGEAVIPKKVEIKEREVIEELLNIGSSPIYNNSDIVIVRCNMRNGINNGSWESHVSIDTAVSEKLREYFRALENN